MLQTPPLPARLGQQTSMAGWWNPRFKRISSKYMAQHRSLRSSSTSAAKRNVLKRFERVEILKRRSQWKAGDRVTGLRKTKPDA